jgi:hypothetical protein
VPLPNLRVSREEARKRIEAKLKEGQEIRNAMGTSILLLTEKNLDAARLKMTNWVQYVKDLLETLFYNGSVVEQFAPSRGYVEFVGTPTFRQNVDEFLKSMEGYLNRLESIYGRLDLTQYVAEETPSASRETSRTRSDTTLTVFISHSSEDVAVIDAVRQAFEDLSLTPIFNEKQPAGGSPAHVISQRIEISKAVFVFFTTNSVSNMDTRDWIIFELGLALAHGKKIFSWKDEGVQVLPKLVEQVTTYRPFETYSNRGALRLTGEVRRVAKELA